MPHPIAPEFGPVQPDTTEQEFSFNSFSLNQNYGTPALELILSTSLEKFSYLETAHMEYSIRNVAKIKSQGILHYV